MIKNVMLLQSRVRTRPTDELRLLYRRVKAHNRQLARYVVLTETFLGRWVITVLFCVAIIPAFNGPIDCYQLRRCDLVMLELP